MKIDETSTCDRHKRNLPMSQSEFSIQRLSTGEKEKRTSACTFGSKYTPTAKIYLCGMPFISRRKESIFLLNARAPL